MKDKTRQCWNDMKRRCLNPEFERYADYGGRGISICNAWMEYANFLADMGPKPDGCLLDRIDNDGNYEPGNCRWVSHSASSSNRRSTKLLEFEGESLPFRHMAAKYGLGEKTLAHRLAIGWGIEKALLTPINKQQAAKGRMNHGLY